MMSFWEGKRVLITGHTGFKGSWLSLWLQKLGASVIGFSLEPPSNPNLFTSADVETNMTSVYGDIRDSIKLKSIFDKYRPEIVFHLAAQALVRKSYFDPVETFSTNIMGTVNLFDAVIHSNIARVVINITSDKCYENREWVWGYRENDPMGGYDPYSCSKGCSELITSSYRNSFLKALGIAVASARAGNVIGGGDWASDRLVPDIIHAISNGIPVKIRSPKAIRPWQHVLDPLNGYLMLAERLWTGNGKLCEGWNFGPGNDSTVTVEGLVENIVKLWGNGAEWYIDGDEQLHEANFLKLDCSKARMKLGWKPVLNFYETLKWVVEWYKEYYNSSDMKQFTLNQIKEFERLIDNRPS